MQELYSGYAEFREAIKYETPIEEIKFPDLLYYEKFMIALAKWVMTCYEYANLPLDEKVGLIR